MKKIFLLGVLLMSCSVVRVQAVDWANIVNVFLPTETKTTETKTAETQSESAINKSLADIQSQIKMVDNSVQNNFLSIVSLLSTKKETKSIQEQLNTLVNDTTTTENEKTELINQIYNTFAESLVAEDTAKNSLKKLSTSKKIELIKQIAALEKNAQQYSALAKQTVTTSTSSFLQSPSTSAEDLVNIVTQTNKTASLLKEKASNTVNFVNQLRTIAKNVGISA